MREKIILALRGFLKEGHPEKVSDIAPEASLFESGILDSLGVVSMVTFLEEQFNCQLDFEDLTEENLTSLNAVTDLVLKKLAK